MMGVVVEEGRRWGGCFDGKGDGEVVLMGRGMGRGDGLSRGGGGGGVVGWLVGWVGSLGSWWRD